ncbi:unnamed protein product, partial [Allacma fusca]
IISLHCVIRSISSSYNYFPVGG